LFAHALLLLLVAALLPPLCNSTRHAPAVAPCTCSRLCAQHRARHCPLEALLGRVEVWRLGHGV
jgi:hypothetical protein